MGAYRCGQNRTSKKKKETARCINGCISSVGRENKETSKKKKETARCMNGCISSVGERIKRPAKRKRRLPGV